MTEKRRKKEKCVAKIDLGPRTRYYLGFVALTPCASDGLGDVAERSKALPC
jgi:hypothetical protein